MDPAVYVGWGEGGRARSYLQNIDAERGTPEETQDGIIGVLSARDTSVCHFDWPRQTIRSDVRKTSIG